VTRRLWFFTSVLLAIDPSGAGVRGGRVEGGNPPGGDDGRRRTVRGEKSGGIAWSELGGRSLRVGAMLKDGARGYCGLLQNRQRLAGSSLQSGG